MPVYRYEAAAASGTVQNGVVTADSPYLARIGLRERGLTVMRVSEVIRPRLRRSRSPAMVATFAQELATLLMIGTPLTTALQEVGINGARSMRVIALSLAQAVESGQSLSCAMERFPESFDQLSMSLVRAGEESGELDSALSRLAEFKLRSRRFRSSLTNSLTYPAIVLAMGVAVTVFLMTSVLPPIIEPLIEMGKPLPTLTLLLKTISDTLIAHGIWLLPTFAALSWISLRVLQRPTAKRQTELCALRLPVLNEMLRVRNGLEVTTILATLAVGGTPLHDNLVTAAHSCRGIMVRESLAAMAMAVSAGKPMASALNVPSPFPTSFKHALQLAQRNGELEVTLRRLESEYQHDLTTRSEQLGTVLEPLVIIVMAGFVLVICLATLLPILEAGNVL